MTDATDAKGERLKPCPFCGETPDAANPLTFQMNQGDKWGFVVCCCNGPEVRTGYQDVEHWRADAIAAWNTRPAYTDAQLEAGARAYDPETWDHSLKIDALGWRRWRKFQTDQLRAAIKAMDGAA